MRLFFTRWFVFVFGVLPCLGHPNTAGHWGFRLVLLGLSAGAWGIGKPFSCLGYTFVIAPAASPEPSPPFVSYKQSVGSIRRPCLEGGRMAVSAGCEWSQSPVLTLLCSALWPLDPNPQNNRQV